jgi:hypothetical protein
MYSAFTTIFDKMDILGEGTFGTCFRGCLQGTPVCLKHLKSSKKENIMQEASVFSGLSHHAICFLLGVQVEEEPYYLFILPKNTVLQSMTSCAYQTPLQREIL